MQIMWPIRVLFESHQTASWVLCSIRIHRTTKQKSLSTKRWWVDFFVNLQGWGSSSKTNQYTSPPVLEPWGTAGPVQSPYSVCHKYPVQFLVTVPRPRAFEVWLCFGTIFLMIFELKFYILMPLNQIIHTGWSEINAANFSVCSESHTENPAKKL